MLAPLTVSQRQSLDLGRVRGVDRERLVAAVREARKVTSLPGSGEGPCLVWTGSSYGFGHGRLMVGETSMAAHRAVYSIATGIPLAKLFGRVLRHTCDNPPCVNPSHIVPGSQRENVQDMMDRGRAPIGERHGMAKLTRAQVEDIRRRHVRGVNRWNRGNTKALCAEYGISDTQLNSIVNFDRWR